MRRFAGWMTGLTLAVSLGGCPTTFSGAAHVQNGRAGCEFKCKESNMRLSGMVFMGEYSTACVCEVAKPAPKPAESAPKPTETDPPPEPTSSASVGSVGAAAAVMLQNPPTEEPLEPIRF